MRSWMILGIYLLAALVPFFEQSNTYQGERRNFTGWPTVFRGRPLIPLQSNAVEARFAERFPGRLARFTDGERELVFRYLERPTRQLHAAADCFKGSGYDVVPEPVHRDTDGELMGCVTATRDGRTVRVCERIFDAEGASWYDVSSWYWAALLKQSKGPWWAVTFAEPA